MAMNDERRVRCSFCGKHQDQVKRMIAGPGVYICNECVNLCMEAMGAEALLMDEDDGQLLGHIIIGTEMVNDKIKTIAGFPPKLASELQHCILAHHGELEYGSPKKPALLEALALNFADNTDAKMETMIEALNANSEAKGWLGFNRLLETNIRRTGE